MTNNQPITSFTNPYLDCRTINKASDEPARINLDIDRDDLNFIKSLRLTSGTISTTTGILFYKLIHELKRRNITDITKRKEFEQFLVEFEFSLPRGLSGSSTGESNQQAHAFDDKGRDERTSARDKETKNEQPVVQSGTSGEEGKASRTSRRTIKQRV